MRIRSGFEDSAACLPTTARYQLLPRLRGPPSVLRTQGDTVGLRTISRLVSINLRAQAQIEIDPVKRRPRIPSRQTAEWSCSVPRGKWTGVAYCRQHMSVQATSRLRHPSRFVNFDCQGAHNERWPVGRDGRPFRNRPVGAWCGSIAATAAILGYH